jgi:chemotaxis protein MotB
MISVQRTVRGVQLTIQSDNAFKSGEYVPTEQLQKELVATGEMICSCNFLTLIL